MSENIQSISQGTYTIGQTSSSDSSLLVTENSGNVSILQGTVATSAGIVGDGSTQNPLRADETVLWSGTLNTTAQTAALSESLANFEYVEMYAYPATAYTAQRAAQGRKFITLSGETNTFYHVKTDNIESNVYYGEDMYITIAGTELKLAAGCRWTGNTYTSAVTAYRGALTKVVGINRIANN